LKNIQKTFAKKCGDSKWKVINTDEKYLFTGYSISCKIFKKQLRKVGLMIIRTVVNTQEGPFSWILQASLTIHMNLCPVSV
jgi:hypothetical protein